MADDLDFLKGLYNEGQEKLEERQLLASVPAVNQTQKMIDGLLHFTRDNSVVSKRLKEIDPAFARQLKILNRKVKDVAGDWEELIGEARNTEELNP